MNREVLERAIFEAYRFIVTAEDALGRIKAGKYMWLVSKETAAVKRASMNLSLALKEVRK